MLLLLPILRKFVIYRMISKFIFFSFILLTIHYSTNSVILCNIIIALNFQENFDFTFLNTWVDLTQKESRELSSISESNIALLHSSLRQFDSIGVKLHQKRFPMTRLVSECVLELNPPCCRLYAHDVMEP